MKFYTFILSVMAVGGAVSCASVSTPDGGPKDLTPPTLESSNPTSQELNVSTKTISLVFDEEVQVKNLNKELLITPNTKNSYKADVSKKTLKLEFEEPLQENTTYTLNFREGVMDITESNKAVGLKLSFSTGSYIDSSKVEGTVVDLMTQLPEKDALVALYPTDDTLNIREDLPYYQTQTNAAGTFKFENVKEGEYSIYALLDKNKNSLYDNEAEKIAYISTPIKATPSTEPVTLQTVRIDTKKPILLRREAYTDRFIASYNEGIAKFSAKPVGNTANLLFKSNADGRAKQIFKTAGYSGGKTILSAVDSSGNVTTDTVQISFEGKRAKLINGAQVKTSSTVNPAGYRQGQLLTIELETPVTVTGAEPLSLYADSILLQKVSYPGAVSLDTTKTELTFKIPSLKTKSKQISIQLDSTALLPIIGEPLQFTPLNVTLAENTGTGSISGSVNSTAENFTIQLLNEKYIQVREIKNQKKFNFTKIEPGPYHLRVLVDENKNGQWDGADPKLKNKIEQVYLYPETIDVRANWAREDIKLEF